MHNVIKKVSVMREKRAMRVRKKLRGTAAKPRLCVVKSNMHIHAQLIDDVKSDTMASVATFGKEFKNTKYSRKNRESAKELGKRLAEKAKELQVKELVFDRGCSKYCGILKELAGAVRANGLKF